MGNLITFIIALLSLILTVVVANPSDVEQEASKYVDHICEEMKMKYYESGLAKWSYETNVTEYNQKLKIKASENFAKFSKDAAVNLLQYNFKRFENATLKRLIKKLVEIDDDLLEPADYRELHHVIANMQGNYAKVKIPSYKDKSKLVQLEPEITEIFETGTDPEELKYYWTQWYDRAGTPVKDDFFKYVELKNKAAKLNRK